MVEIYRYTYSDQSLWDDFVPNANNGTLFHLRSFLSYHPYDRFVDHSLLVNKKGKLFSVFPAAEQEIDGNRYLVSHPGSSVGSFVVNEDLSIADSIDLVKSLEEKISQPTKILDLGTGTGCIIISLYLELYKKISVLADATDISSEALEIAKKNARRHNIDNKINFFKSNWFSNGKNKYDIIVSNPPYIKKNKIGSLPPEVKKFDPRYRTS